MKPLLIVSADNHIGPDPSAYRPYIDKKYLGELAELDQEQEDFNRITGPFSTFTPEALDVIDEQNAIRSGGVSGAWDMERRLVELDREGVAAEIVQAGIQTTTPPFFGQTNRKRPPELRWAGSKAFHRWFADFALESDGRVLGIAEPGPCHDMAATTAELRWARDHGFVAVGAPGIVKDETLPPLYDSHFEPFWTVCEELDLVVVIHAGFGRPQGSVFTFADKMAAEAGYASGLMMGDVESFRNKLKESRESPFYLDVRPRRAYWQMMLGGVFDRHPALRVAFSEVRGDWVPGTLDYLDRRLEKEGVGLKCRASEYFQRSGFVIPSSPRPYELDLLRTLGPGKVMMGVDYPHPEGTWPNTADWLRIVLKDVNEEEARRFLGENAVDCFRLDGPKLRAIADRIGPAPEAVIGSRQPVDPRKAQHFDSRSGFLQPAEDVDADLLDIAVGQDIAGSRAHAAG